MTAFIRKFGRFFIIAWLVYMLARSVYYTVDYLNKTHFSAPIDLIFDDFFYYAFDSFFIVLLFLKRYHLLFFLASYYAVLLFEYLLLIKSYTTFDWLPIVHHVCRVIVIVFSFILIPLSDAGVFNLLRRTRHFDRTLKAMTLFNGVMLSLWSAFFVVGFVFFPPSIRNPIMLLGILCVVAFIVRFFVARNFLTIALFGMLGVFLISEVSQLLVFGVVYFLEQVRSFDTVAVPIALGISIPAVTLVWLFVRALNIHRAERLQFVDEVQTLDYFERGKN